MFLSTVLLRCLHASIDLRSPVYFISSHLVEVCCRLQIERWRICWQRSFERFGIRYVKTCLRPVPVVCVAVGLSIRSVTRRHSISNKKVIVDIVQLDCLVMLLFHGVFAIGGATESSGLNWLKSDGERSHMPEKFFNFSFLLISLYFSYCMLPNWEKNISLRL